MTYTRIIGWYGVELKCLDYVVKMIKVYVI